MWSEKYRPQIISDMVGNEEHRAAIMEWFAKWKIVGAKFPDSHTTHYTTHITNSSGTLSQM